MQYLPCTMVKRRDLSPPSHPGYTTIFNPKICINIDTYANVIVIAMSWPQKIILQQRFSQFYFVVHIHRGRFWQQIFIFWNVSNHFLLFTNIATSTWCFKLISSCKLQTIVNLRFLYIANMIPTISAIRSCLYCLASRHFTSKLWSKSFKVMTANDRPNRHRLVAQSVRVLFKMQGCFLFHSSFSTVNLKRPWEWKNFYNVCFDFLLLLMLPLACLLYLVGKSYFPFWSLKRDRTNNFTRQDTFFDTCHAQKQTNMTARYAVSLFNAM